MAKIFLILALIIFNTAHAVEACSRIATINFQEVLVDSNSSDKGEGLRYHLEKDAEAKKYLDLYQKNSSVTWPNAVLGTLGSSMALIGFFGGSNTSKELFLIGGASLLFVNFIIAKGLETRNEANLIRAIEEYNKRNLPKIYFAPEENRSQIDFLQYKVGILSSWSF